MTSVSTKYIRYLSPLSVFCLVTQPTRVFLTINDIRSGTNHPDAFPVSHEFYTGFRRILKERAK